MRMNEPAETKDTKTQAQLGKTHQLINPVSRLHSGLCRRTLNYQASFSYISSFMSCCSKQEEEQEKKKERKREETEKETDEQEKTETKRSRRGGERWRRKRRTKRSRRWRRKGRSRNRRWKKMINHENDRSSAAPSEHSPGSLSSLQTTLWMRRGWRMILTFSTRFTGLVISSRSVNRTQ